MSEDMPFSGKKKETKMAVAGFHRMMKDYRRREIEPGTITDNGMNIRSQLLQQSPDARIREKFVKASKNANDRIHFDNNHLTLVGYGFLKWKVANGSEAANKELQRRTTK